MQRSVGLGGGAARRVARTFVFACLVTSAALTGLGGCGPEEPEATPVPPPSGDCATDQANLQAAISGGGLVALAPGRYCLLAPLVVPSATTVLGAGSGDDEATNTILEQRTRQTGIFHVSGVRLVRLESMRLEFCEDTNQPCYDPPLCEPSPIDGSCAFRRSSGVAVYGSYDVRMRDLHVVGGSYGIVLADHPLLDRPTFGPDARFLDLGHERYVIAADPCSEGRDNFRIELLDSVIEGAHTDGVLVLNATRSRFERNHVRGSRRLNGFKLGCGPVRDSEWRANYLYGNHADGLDAAWAWTNDERPLPGCDPASVPPPPAGEPPACRILNLEEPPDGPLEDITLIGNLAWDNGLNGIALKARTGTACGEEEDDLKAWQSLLPPELQHRVDPNADCCNVGPCYGACAQIDPEEDCDGTKPISVQAKTNPCCCARSTLPPLLQIGALHVHRNAAWGNGRREAQASLTCEPDNAPPYKKPVPSASQFQLSDVVPPNGCTQEPARRLLIDGNVWMHESPGDECSHATYASGMGLGMLRSARITRNWMDGPLDGTCEEPALYLFDPSIQYTDMAYNYVDVSGSTVTWCEMTGTCRGDLLYLGDINFDDGHNSSKQVHLLLNTSMPPTAMDRDSLLAWVRATDPYHDLDDDGDMEANFDEALEGADPLTNTGDCWSP